MRFLLDEDLNPATAEIGRGLGLDVVSVHEIDRRGFSDEEQLRFAIAHSWTFVTRNRDDFLRLTRSFFDAGEIHHGILIVPYSLPNHRPERIARALENWIDQPGDPGAHFVDFLRSKARPRGKDQ
jgi:predicted nuclease of predicted toxin-antitoxin system